MATKDSESMGCEVAVSDPNDSRGDASTRWRAQRGFWALTLAFLPAFLFFALGIRAVEPINGQDGYLYAGIAARLTDFLTRFPDSYYGVRFGHILPTVLFNRVFGLEAGHLLWRFLLLGLICSLLRVGGRIRPVPALLAGVIICTSPIILVAAFTTYTMSTGVLTFVAASTMLAVHRSASRAAWWRLSGAGALFALSWNSNFAVLPVAIVVCGVFLADQSLTVGDNKVRLAAKSAGALAFGTLAVVVPAVLVYGFRFGIWNVYAPTFAQALTPTSDVFIDPGLEWLSWRHFILVGPLAIAAVATAWLTEPNARVRIVLRRFTLLSTSCVIAYGGFQWGFATPLLSLYIYSALPLALCTVSFAFAVATVVGRLRPRLVTPVAIGVAVLVVASTAAGSRWGAPFWVILTTSGLVIAAVIYVARARPRLLVLSTVSVALAASWTAVSSPHDFPASPGGYRLDPWYDDVLFAYDDSSLNRINILQELSDSLPSLPASRGEIAVWFDSLGPFDQLTAPFLWYRSALQSATDPPMPAMTDDVRERVVDDRPRFVVIIDGDKTDVLQGIVELVALAPYAVVWQRGFESGGTTSQVALLERSDGLWRDFPCDDPKSAQPITCP